LEPLPFSYPDRDYNRSSLVGSAPTPLAAELQMALLWLDNQIKEALSIATGSREPGSGSDPFRGLHISEAEVARLFRQAPGEPLLASRDFSARYETVPIPSGLLPFVRDCGLSDFDVAAALVAAAPDIDLRYERLYAFLQDDVRRRRPTVDFVLNLLCGSPDAKLTRRAHFASDGPLRVHRIVNFAPVGTDAEPPLLAQGLFLDPQVLAALLGEASLDPTLSMVATGITTNMCFSKDVAVAFCPPVQCKHPMYDGLYLAPTLENLIGAKVVALA